MRIYIIDSNPTDSRMTLLKEGECVPTVTAHIHKASAVGPLVLIDNESICDREPSERQPCDDGSGRDSTDPVVEDGNRRKQHAVCPHYFYESRFAEWKPYDVASIRAEGGSCGNGSEGLVCSEFVGGGG